MVAIVVHLVVHKYFHHIAYTKSVRGKAGLPAPAAPFGFIRLVLTMSDDEFEKHAGDPAHMHSRAMRRRVQGR